MTEQEPPPPTVRAPRRGRGRGGFSMPRHKPQAAPTLPSGSDSPSAGGLGTAGGSKVLPASSTLSSLPKARLLPGFREASAGSSSSPGQGEVAVMSAFSTGRGQPVAVTAEALTRAKTVLGSAETKEHSANAVSGFGGFKTGRGNMVQVSNEALAKARGILGSEKVDGGLKPVEAQVVKISAEAPMAGFSTGRGQAVTVSEEALAKARAAFGGEKPVTSNRSPAPMGFSTGRGKPVHVSEEALARVRGVFAESPQAPIAGFSTGRGQPVKVSDEALAQARGILGKEASENSPAALMGFSTGRGKPVHVSEEALAKVRGVLATVPDALMTGFSTGRGQTVQVSNEALVQAKGILGSKEQSPEAVGFSTGRGKPVTVSREALEKVRGVLAGAPDTGFSTGRGQKVNVSKEALARGRSFLATTPQSPMMGFEAAVDSKEDPALSSMGGLRGAPASSGVLRGPGTGGGFSTAGGAAIQVSETALRAARGVLAGTGGAGDTAGTGISRSTLAPRAAGMAPRARIAPRAAGMAPRARMTPRAPADPELEMDWGDEDEESLAALAELSELQPYSCRPWDLAPHPAPYRGGPDILDCPEQEGAEGGFVTPFTGPQKRRAGPEVDLGSVLGKKARKEMEEQEEKEEEVVLSVEELRAVARGRQEALVAAKRSRRIRPMPGRLLSKRSSHTRLAPEELMTRCELGQFQCRYLQRTAPYRTVGGWVAARQWLG